jgi:hypothetical protein
MEDGEEEKEGQGLGQGSLQTGAEERSGQRDGAASVGWVCASSVGARCAVVDFMWINMRVCI